MKTKFKLLNEIQNGRLAFKKQSEIVRTPPFVAHTKQAKKNIKLILKELEDEGYIIKDPKGRYCTAEQLGVFSGTFQGNEKGFGFVTPDEKRPEGDIFIPRSAVGGALDGDKVLLARKKGTADEGFIVKICERGRKRITGTFENNRLYPDDVKMPEVTILRSLGGNARNGDKVLVEITLYRPSATPCGKVIEILGESGDFEAEELSIIRSYGLYETFPDSVLKEAEEISSQKIVAGKRKDLRDLLIFTIDGEDTRDIDDGISLDCDGKKYTLGVHIADVSHYVKYKSKLDREAYNRGTSVYFPERVLPMLPKQLSNGVCSLNENEDRYALSCFMTFDNAGNRLDYDICKSIIKSRHKMTYKAVNEILDGNGRLCAEYPDIADTVRNMKKLCLLMEEKRKKAGEISLDLKEVKIYADADGNIVIPDYSRGISERIIEQFMISANEAVAEFLTKHKAPCLYRIHEKPAPEKASNLSSFLKDLGINAVYDTENVKPSDYQNILNKVADKPYSAVINKVMLRSMQKARYSEQNAGHFGLASACYCHFTSPIRRYPDLFVHRVIKEILKAGNSETEMCKVFIKNAPQAGIDCSEKERIADQAERDVDALYITVYMSDHIGEVFDATVSGVTNFGVFCELANTIEGLIPIEALPPDVYECIPEKFILKGKRRTFRLGDAVKIRVDGCDFGKMRTMFSLYE